MSNTKIRRALPLLALVAAAVVAAPALLAAEERFEKAYELAGIDKVRLQNVNGPVRIESWDRDYLRVTAVKRAKGSQAEEVLRETEVRIAKHGAQIDIETILPKRTKLFGLFNVSHSPGAEVAYDLLLPGSMAIDVETVNGRITTIKRLGSMNLSTVNGAVRVEDQAGPLKVNTVNGSVEVTFAGAIRPAELETVNGSVTVAGAKDSSIRYDLQTVNGRIESEFASLDVKKRWGPKSARGEVNGGRDTISVETVNGVVRLQVAEK
jgi:DUF4097 and DUF4098 domain-containing protein YvlB